MAKHKNQTFYGTPEKLQELADEIEFIGREHYYDKKNGVLIVFALPRRHKKSPKTKAELNKTAGRNKRAESAARNS